MKRQLRFRIGDWVYVRGRCVAQKEFGTVWAIKRSVVNRHFEKPCWGQICGAKRLASGTTTVGSYDAPSYFTAQKYSFTWQVRQGLLNAPMHCLEEDLTDEEEALRNGAPAHPVRLPLILQKQPRWSDADLAFMREEAAARQRDALGRFVKGVGTKENADVPASVPQRVSGANADDDAADGG